MHHVIAHNTACDWSATGYVVADPNADTGPLRANAECMANSHTVIEGMGKAWAGSVELDILSSDLGNWSVWQARTDDKRVVGYWVALSRTFEYGEGRRTNDAQLIDLAISHRDAKVDEILALL
ncbi:hypothetical protein HOT75_gp157 [Gordonia phage Daredevil]|uniref:Uncharacterized protein n=1 Tax=Gordonia phage Daredevil TaxID=2283286 RepID=A0A345MJ12_9CAUD|nr:hypothetical protein HOT75_gp157 [Gordonia phage Daredevil]AXH70543.1 hypothetical protein SEA_DAREDEVIL_157 [Gordonia phage Daredevil]